MNRLGKLKLSIIKGDLVFETSEVIVNAANTDLLLGGGVAGAILKKGGTFIQEECDQLAPISLGGVAITKAGDLSAKMVYHVAMMKSGGRSSTDIITLAMKNILRLAEEKKIKTLSMPAIGCGIAGVSIRQGVRPILTVVRLMSPQIDHELSLRIVLFTKEDYETFVTTAQSMELPFDV